MSKAENEKPVNKWARKDQTETRLQKDNTNILLKSNFTKKKEIINHMRRNTNQAKKIPTTKKLKREIKEIKRKNKIKIKILP